MVTGIGEAISAFVYLLFVVIGVLIGLCLTVALLIAGHWGLWLLVPPAISGGIGYWLADRMMRE